MKDTKIPELNREEDHLVKATLIVDGSEINDVPCKIYLPERIHEKPYVIVKPSKEDAIKIGTSHKGALKANVYGFDKKIITSIEAPIIYFSGYSTKHWGNGISDSTIPGEPQDLHVVSHLTANEHPEKMQIVFWVSPNQFLEPAISSTSSYTGDITCKRVNNLEFMLEDDVKLVFDTHFSSKRAKNGDFVQWSFLVACAELSVSANDVGTLKNSLLPVIDDFLLIASFASKQRTACLGWTASDKNSYATFYRGNYTFPQNDTEVSVDDGLIEIKHFEKFAGTCYSAFSKFENKLALRNALHSVVPSRSSTVETSFLSMFAGLETIVLDFRRREALEFVLSEKDWTALRRYLQKCIKCSADPKLERGERASIYSKLDELNRVSLKEAFDAFCIKYSVDFTDLWPVFGEKEVVGLVDIRNKLIHGDPFPHDLFRALVIAKEHLMLILERVLVRVLQWDVAETKVNPDYLRTHFTVIKDMPSEQARLSEYIFNSVCTKVQIHEK